MRWSFKRFARNMIVLAIVLAAIAAVVVLGFELLINAAEVNDCQHYRNVHIQSFDDCMNERYGK